MKLGEVVHPERPLGQPLRGIRILALEQMQALPFATQLMAHLGAEIVKVEHPERGDTGRASRPTIQDDDGRAVGATYLRNNLSKRSIGIDLKQPEGAELVRRLAPRFDVFAENMRPGTLGPLGLDYATISALDARIVYCSISGFGNLERSPYASWPSYAPVAEAMAGMYEPTRADGEAPRVVPAGALGDNAAALFAIIGLLAALRERELSGQGQYVDISMYDSMIGITDMITNMWSLGQPRTSATSGRTGIVDSFRARDGYFVMAVLRENQFEKLCQIIGHPEWLDDPRFATREGWAEHRNSVVRPALEAWASGFGKLEVSERLGRAGIVAGPSNEPQDIAADPHVALRNMLIEVPLPDRPADQPMLVVGNPVKLSGTPEGPVGRFPRLAEHTAEVLRDELGVSSDELAALRARGVINRDER